MLNLFYNVNMKRRQIWLFEILIWLLILTIGCFSFVYNTQIKNNDQNTYYVFFDDVEGLVKGSPVRLMGINIGYIRAVKIFDNKVFVSFEITKKETRLPKCALATIEFYGLGGSTSLELNPAGALEYNETKAEIIPSKSYRIQDYWEGSALDSQVLIDIYGSFGRNVTNEDILKYKPYAFQSKLIKDLSSYTKEANKTQTVIINKFTKDTQKYIEENNIEKLENQEAKENDD